MIIKTFTEPPIENNNYLLIDDASKEAVLIDCSSVDSDVQKTIDEYGAKLKYILLTHGHFDHVAGISQFFTDKDSAPSRISVHQAELSERNSTLPLGEGKPLIVMQESDLGILNQANQYYPMFGMPEITIPKIDIFIKDGDIIKFGNTDIKVIHTPGHTQGGVCYLVDNMLFSGDTIFREAVGRCDLEGGNFEQIVESIESKIFTLPDDILIYPGHGPSSTVGWEKEHNKFL